MTPRGEGPFELGGEALAELGHLRGYDGLAIALVRVAAEVALARFGLIDRTPQFNLCNLLRSDTRMSQT